MSNTNNIITQDNFNSSTLNGGLQLTSRIVVTGGSDYEGGNSPFAILANQINWGDKKNSNGTYLTTILGQPIKGPTTKDMFDTLEEAIDSKIGGISTGGGNCPDIEFEEQESSTPTPGMSTAKYISGMTAKGHKITYTCDYLPLLSLSLNGSVGTTLPPNEMPWYISSINKGEHSNEIIYTYNELPHISVQQASSSTGPDNNKYITKIYADGHHTIKYEVADLQTFFPTVDKLWDDYIPPQQIEFDRNPIILILNAAQNSGTTAVPTIGSKEVEISGNMSSIEITEKSETSNTNTQFDTICNASVRSSDNKYVLKVEIKEWITVPPNIFKDMDFNIKLHVTYKYGEPITETITVQIRSPFTTPAPPPPTHTPPPNGVPNQVSSSTAPGTNNTEQTVSSSYPPSSSVAPSNTATSEVVDEQL